MEFGGDYIDSTGLGNEGKNMRNKKKNQNKENQDWRLVTYNGEFDNQEFEFTRFVSNAHNDHEHCEFCFIKITDLIIPGEETSLEGYVYTNDIKKQSYWVCPECFSDFKNELNLKIK